MAAHDLPDLPDHDAATDQPVDAIHDDDDASGTEPELRRSADGEASPNAQPPRRKGGRKPVYATAEERKQRNRQAQAAFRERRTEYIKQLESTLKQHDQLLRTAQNDQHAIANDCSALRYKIVTLEKIMAEKGIDVDAELRAKGEPPDLPMSTYSSLPKAKPHPLPLAVASPVHRSPGSSIRGLAPKTDLRGKMARLEAGHSAPDPWQQTLPDTHPSVPGMQAQSFAVSKAFDQANAGFHVGQLSHGLSHSSPIEDHFDPQQQASSGPNGQPEDYGHDSSLVVMNDMNALGKLAHYDFYPPA